MLNLYAIATRPGALSAQLQIPLYADFEPVYQARPGMHLPVIMLENDLPVIHMAYWGYATEPRMMPTYALPVDKVLTQAPFNRWIHQQRCLIPVNCFFGRATRITASDASDIYLVRMLTSRLFFMGGLYSVETNDHHSRTYRFTVLTTASADVLRPVMDEMPVVLLQDHLHTWLAAEHLIDIMQLADRSGDHWFDFFPVNREIIHPGNNRRDLLKPLGASWREKDARVQRLKAIDVKEERFDRRGGKH